MKKVILSLSVLAVALTFTSCSESSNDVNEFENWQARNDEYFNTLYATAVANPTDYVIYTNWSLEDTIAIDPEDHIVVRVLNKGTGSGCPYYTDSVSVHYSGRLIPSASYPEGYLFDKSWTGTYNLATMVPTHLAVSSVVDGFATAVMNMHIGDRWLVYVPYALGYDSQSQSSTVFIPAYSTLIFDITLQAYYRAGTDVPDTRAPIGWVER